MKPHSRRLLCMCDAQYRKCRKCDHRCNAKQCTVLWMGRQVLYEWRGSCDRSTSQSRYFSLTVNTHTRDQPVKTIARLRGWKRARHARKHHIRVLRRTTALCRGYGRAPGGFFNAFLFFLWMEIVICKWEWLRKKKKKKKKPSPVFRCGRDGHDGRFGFVYLQALGWEMKTRSARYWSMILFWNHGGQTAGLNIRRLSDYDVTHERSCT